MTPAVALGHARPPHATALSLIEREIGPRNAEGPSAIGTVPVVAWHTEGKPSVLANVIAQALKQQRIIMVHGHGSFAIGQLLEEAYNITTMLEESCQILCLLKSLQVSSSNL